MTAPTEHDQTIRRAFTQQAAAYAANPNISDRARIARLIEAMDLQASDKVLEVATGPGYIALALGALVREVVGIDLTAAPLAIAERLRQQYGLANVRFETANALDLPFAAATFEAAVCRLAFHHFEAPQPVLQEMVRVCKSGGTVAVQDMVASEHPQRAAYHNRVERLRDPSHTTALSLSRLLTMFAEAGLEVTQVSTEYQPQVVEAWLKSGHTPPAEAAQVRELLRQDLADDLSGMETFRDAEGALGFKHRMAIVVGRKLAL